MNIILMGAPGAGKGTQADLMKQRLRVPHVSSGDLFRENIRNSTVLGKQVKAILDRGDLVPDSVTIAMIGQRIAQPDCSRGLILDGFPRTIPQAEALDALFVGQGGRVDHVVYVKVASEKLVERLAGRWFCKVCQTPYHIIHNPPRIAGQCDREGGELIQRPDDRPETVSNRLKVYFDQTAPLIAYYAKQGVLAEVNGDQDIERVYAEIAAALGVQ
ncbi:MAG: adenylate kinase [Chloroflexi bacterium]|nr:adenylate kinase [Chloroflexota bacterium]